MIRADREFFARGMEARLILQVHDELIVEAPRDEAQRAAGILRGAMEKASELAVPLTVSVATGENRRRIAGPRAGSRVEAAI